MKDKERLFSILGLVSPEGERLEIPQEEIEKYHEIFSIGEKRTTRLLRTAANSPVTLQELLAMAYVQGLSDGGLIQGDRE